MFDSILISRDLIVSINLPNHSTCQSIKASSVNSPEAIFDKELTWNKWERVDGKMLLVSCTGTKKELINELVHTNLISYSLTALGDVFLVCSKVNNLFLTFIQ
jgi:hypothetical protein